MDYTLCSSEEEEGQLIQKTSFPTRLSVLQYCYYPNTQIFIGDNTIPRLSDFPGGEMTIRMKKKFKKDYFDLIGLYKDKAFFDNKFEKVSLNDINNVIDNTLLVNNNRMYNSLLNNELNNNLSNTILNNKLLPVLMYVESDYKKISSFTILKKGTDPYLDIFNRLIYQENKTKVIIIKDTILSKLQKKNIYIYFRILKNGNILFEDVYYKSINAYEYLEVYFEEICKEYKSIETRYYEYGEHTLVIFSSTVFYMNDELMRYHNTIDCTRNFIAVINRNNIEIKGIQVEETCVVSFIKKIIEMGLEEGDYAYNKGDIYKIGLQGDRIIYDGINYELLK